MCSRAFFVKYSKLTKEHLFDKINTNKCSKRREGMYIQESITMYEKLNILTDAAKYDVACTSSGTERHNDGTGMGNCQQSGICHSFSADGRCISLLKILFTDRKSVV